MLYQPLDSVFQDVGDAEITPPEWVVEGVVPIGLSFYVGPPKSLKSTLVLALSLEVAGVKTGVLPPELCKVPEEGLVLGLSAEADAGVLRHTAQEGFNVQVPADGRMRVCSDPWRFRLDSADNMRELLEWCNEVQPRILFIDPLRNLHNVEENDSGHMVAMLQPLQHYAVKHKMAVMCVHHTKKLDSDSLAKSSDMRGTSALLGLADGVLAMTGRPGSSNSVNVSAQFKRAAPWDRVIELGIWGEKAVEKIDSFSEQVLKHLKHGKSQTEAAKALGAGKGRVNAAVAQLKRLGVVSADGVVIGDVPASAVEKVNSSKEKVG